MSQKIKLMIENAYTIGKTNHIVETRNIESVANAGNNYAH